MFGWVTPNLSIRVLKILKERSIALSDSVRSTFNTSSFEELLVILGLFSLVANNAANLTFGFNSLYAS